MARIYLDSNVYSNLRSIDCGLDYKISANMKPIYVDLLKHIKQYSNNLSFTFSPTHISDKYKDKTDNVHLDLEFMENLAGDNHISYHLLKKNSSFYLATPKMVYNDADSRDRFTKVSEILNSTELLGGISIKEFMQTTYKALSNAIDLKDIQSNDDYKVFANIFNPNGNVFDNMLAFWEKMYNNTSYYKEIREHLFKYLNKGKYVYADTGLDFVDSFKDGILEKKFIDYVKSLCTKTANDEIPYYDFYIQSYFCLDMLGVSKDKIKNSGKNGFNNLLNDAEHSYYARYCDFLVTDDLGLRNKSEILYSLYDVNTEIHTAESFCRILCDLGESKEQSSEIFLNRFINDIEIVEPILIGESDCGNVYYIHTSSHYFNFFDEIFILDNNVTGRYYILSKVDTHYLSQANFRETEKIVNRCIHVFGEDVDKIGEFDFGKETNDLSNNVWNGRYWYIEGLLISLLSIKEFNGLCLKIDPNFKDLIDRRLSE